MGRYHLTAEGLMNDVLARYAVETNCYQLIFFLAGYYQLIVAHANGAADWHPLGKQPTGQAFCAN